jgi:penicillin-binding protein-related factor A (putative recombinase)
MENKEDKAQDLLFKQLIRHFMNEQLEQLKENSKNKNRSFVYLENNTLNMLLVYLLMQMNPQKKYENHSDNSDFIPEEIFEELNSVLKQNKEGFEEIIHRLKEET